MKTSFHKIIEDLRGTDLPKDIVRTNGRVEGTQIDVAAKFPGRLATVTVDEGQDVAAGQVIARISSPEIEAQLRGARSQVLKALGVRERHSSALHHVCVFARPTPEGDLADAVPLRCSIGPMTGFNEP